MSNCEAAFNLMVKWVVVLFCIRKVKYQFRKIRKCLLQLALAGYLSVSPLLSCLVPQSHFLILLQFTRNRKKQGYALLSLPSSPLQAPLNSSSHHFFIFISPTVSKTKNKTKTKENKNQYFLLVPFLNLPTKPIDLVSSLVPVHSLSIPFF